MRAHHTSKPGTYLEVKRSKRINAHTVYGNGKAYEVQTWYTDGAQRPASATSAVTSNVKVARSRDASDRCWPISRERNVLELPKLVRRLSTPRTKIRTSLKVKDKGQGYQADKMLRPEVRHIFRTGRPVQAWYTDGS